MHEIRDAIVAMIERNTVRQVVPARVTSVDETERTCDVQPLDDGAPLLAVRLQAVAADGQQGKGIVVVPKVGSVVLCAMVENSNAVAFVAATSEFQKIVVDGENPLSMTVEASGEVRLNAARIAFNDGANGGTVLARVLAAELLKIKTFCDTLRAALAAAVPVPGDGGAALKAALAAALAPLDTGAFGQNLENEKIRH